MLLEYVRPGGRFFPKPASVIFAAPPHAFSPITPEKQNVPGRKITTSPLSFVVCSVVKQNGILPETILADCPDIVFES